MESINVQRLKTLLDSDSPIALIDVRTVPEYHSERIDCNALKNHPLSDIAALARDKAQRIYVSCQTGNRSAQAIQKLTALGYTSLVNIDGGLNAWKAAGYAVTKTQGTFPIMRQVQIAAGSLVLLGSLGSLYLNPALIWLSVFVGAGLTLAGLSGFCGMALLLAQMPWNKAMCAKSAA